MTEDMAVAQNENNDAVSQPTVDPSRAALVKQWLAKIEDAEKYYRPIFEQMRNNQRIATRGDTKKWVENTNNYVVPVLNRHINMAVSQLFARAPQAEWELRQRREYAIWDGDMQSATEALDAVMGSLTTGIPADPNHLAILQDIADAEESRKVYEALGETLTILYGYFMDEQDMDYRQQIKALIRRVKVCKVGYVTLDFQRDLNTSPDLSARLDSTAQQLNRTEALLAEAGRDALPEESAKSEELRLLMEDLQRQADIIVREGPVLGFPKSTNVVIDPKCRHLKTLSGANWVAIAHDLDPEDVQQIYGVSITGQFTARKVEDVRSRTDEKRTVARVWEVQDKRNMQTFAVCEGHADFLREPAAPEVKIDRFWTIWPLVFNEIENDEELFPPSDIELAGPMQREYNRIRQALRDHRVANAPKYALRKGAMEESDLHKLGEANAHDVIELNIPDQGRVADVLMPIQFAGVDPNLYQVEQTFDDMQRVIGTQEANFGGTSNGTATETSVAEQSRMSGLSDNADDIDWLLTSVARAMGQLMLLKLSKETVVEIVGPGAVWPDMPERREEISKELFLKVRAGSSGRPNKAAELANIERAAPFVMQLPGFNPKPLIERYCKLLDIDIDQAFVEGMPSITALNGIAVASIPKPGADPGAGPQAQGAEGANKAPAPTVNEKPPQPGYPAPMA